MKILTFITCVLLLISCKKEENPTGTSSNYPIPTKVGTYWVYECNNRDINGNITSMGITDTVRIIGDTLIDGHLFITYEGTKYGSGLYRWYNRDSSGFIIDNHSVIQFSINSFNDTLRSYIESSLWKMDWIMKPFSGSQTIVPAGNFNASDYQGHCRKVDGEPFAGCGNDLYITHNFYAPKIGLIKSNTIFFGQLETQCSDMERILSSYHIE